MTGSNPIGGVSIVIGPVVERFYSVDEAIDARVSRYMGIMELSKDNGTEILRNNELRRGVTIEAILLWNPIEKTVDDFE